MKVEGCYQILVPDIFDTRHIPTGIYLNLVAQTHQSTASNPNDSNHVMKLGAWLDQADLQYDCQSRKQLNSQLNCTRIRQRWPPEKEDERNAPIPALQDQGLDPSPQFLEKYIPPNYVLTPSAIL